MGKRKKRDVKGDYLWVDSFFKGFVSLSEKKVAIRLKNYRKNMAEVYEEIWEKISKLSPPKGLTIEGHACQVLDIIVGAGCYYNETAMKQERWRHKQLLDIQQEIEKKSIELRTLLDKFSAHREQAYCSPSAHIDIFDLIERAGRSSIGARSGKFEMHILPLINEIQRFHGDYYPSLQEILQELIFEMESSELEPHYPQDAKVFKFQKTSQADFIRSMLTALEYAKRCCNLSKKFDLSNESIITITSCVMDNPNKDELSHARISQIRNSIKN